MPRKAIAVNEIGRMLRICAVVAIGLFVSVVYAQDNAGDSAFTIEKYLQTFMVQEDGSYIEKTEELRRISQERGLKSSAQQYIHFNAGLQSLEILEAYTQKPDGRKIHVKDEQIRVQQEARSVSAPMFQDAQFKVIIFPEVAVGDRLYFRYQRNERVPLFPHQFQHFVVPLATSYQDARTVYDLPVNMRLADDNRGFKKIAETTANGRTRYEWEYVSTKRPRTEAGAVAFTDYGARLFVSTFGDYAALAGAYERRAADKTAASEKITQLANKLGAGLPDPASKVKALYDWVRRNIRYVAVYIGPGGVVPHSADEVLDNLYGDCKDHVVILEALLRAIGIDSTPALINSGNAYLLPAVPGIGILNHVLTYVPVLDLYLDSTAYNIEYGYLPMLDLHKKTLLTKSGKIGRTPDSQLDRVSSTLEITVNDDGSAIFNHTESHRGWTAEPTRYISKNLSPGDRMQIVRQILRRANLQGDGRFDGGNSDHEGAEYTYATTGRIESLVSFPGPFGVPAMTNFGTGIANHIHILDSENERRLAFTCFNQVSSEALEMSFPQSVKVISIPKNITIENKFFRYGSTYASEKGKVTVVRSWTPLWNSSLCTPENYRAMQEDLKLIRKDLSGQIVLAGQAF